MVTSSAVVGSSAISSVGPAGQRHRDHHALAHAAGELVRIVVEPLLRRSGCRTSAQQSRWRRARGAASRHARDARRTPRRSGSRPCSTGLSEVIGSWKIMRDVAAAHEPAPLCARQAAAGRLPVEAASRRRVHRRGSTAAGP